MISSSPSKRLNSTTGISRISSFPESLIIHILSFLGMRDRIKTGVLSRSWRYLWACVPNLVFDYSPYSIYSNDGGDAPQSQTEFINLVDKTLILRNGARVERFEVNSFWYNDQNASNVDLWAHFAARNCIYKLRLWFTLRFSETKNCLVEYYRLPQFLFTNTSVRELLFDGCVVNPCVPVTWNSLKKLTLRDATRVSEDDIQRILEGSPVLESLELFVLDGMKSLHLGTSSVKELLVDCWEKEFELSAPNLRSLEISGSFSGYCKLLDLTSLAEASLDDVDWDNRQGVDFVGFTRGLLDNILHVESLTLGDVGIQAIAEVYPKGALSKCKYLTIDTHLWVPKPLQITSLLESCPQLKMLIIIISQRRSKLEDTLATSNQIVKGDAFWKSHKSDFSGLKLVKTIKFIDFWDYHAFPFSLAEFLLEKASTLKKLVVSMERKHSGRSATADERSKVAEKLSKLPKSSPDAELVVY